MPRLSLRVPPHVLTLLCPSSPCPSPSPSLDSSLHPGVPLGTGTCWGAQQWPPPHCAASLLGVVSCHSWPSPLLPTPPCTAHARQHHCPGWGGAGVSHSFAPSTKPCSCPLPPSPLPRLPQYPCQIPPVLGCSLRPRPALLCRSTSTWRAQRRHSCRNVRSGCASAARTLTSTPPGAPGAPGRMSMLPSSTSSEGADPLHRHPLPPCAHPLPHCTLCMGTPRAGGAPPVCGSHRQPTPTFPFSCVVWKRHFTSDKKSCVWLYYDEPWSVFLWGGGGCWATRPPDSVDSSWAHHRQGSCLPCPSAQGAQTGPCPMASHRLVQGHHCPLRGPHSLRLLGSAWGVLTHG